MSTQGSFLRGAIATRHLPSADVALVVERDTARLPQGATSTTFQCTNNLHIPACRPPTDGCTTSGLPTDVTCATVITVC